MHFADMFQTDSQITGGSNGDGAQMRELEEWQPDSEVEHHDLEDSNNGANGWNALEMFEENERKYGVQSTYKQNLEGYTVQLSADKNSEEYK